MIHQSDIEELQKSVSNFERLIASYNKVEHVDSVYQQFLTEAIDILDEIFGESNKYSLNIINKSNAPYAFNFDGIVSQDVIRDIRGILKASLKASKRLKKKNGMTPKDKEPFVDFSRIEELKKIESQKFDLSKVIAICNELNQAKFQDNHLSIPLLTRALIDHVPPVFQFKSFNEVANNYGSKSFKDSMSHLNKSSRKIADSYLHTHIRKNESLPNYTQVNFSSDLDVLLGEIARILQ